MKSEITYKLNIFKMLNLLIMVSNVSFSNNSQIPFTEHKVYLSHTIIKSSGDFSDVLYSQKYFRDTKFFHQVDPQSSKVDESEPNLSLLQEPPHSNNLKGKRADRNVHGHFMARLKVN